MAFAKKEQAKRLANDLVSALEERSSEELQKYLNDPDEFEQKIDGTVYKLRIYGFDEGDDSFRIAVAVSYDTLLSDFMPTTIGFSRQKSGQ